MVEERIEPIAPEIKFNLTNSVKSLEKDFIFPSGTKNEDKLNLLKNYAKRYTLLFGYAVNKITKDTETDSNIEAFFNGQIYEDRNEKKKIEWIMLKLNNLDNLKNKEITKTLEAWCVFLSSPKGKILLGESYKLGYVINLPALFEKIFTQPEYYKCNVNNLFYLDCELLFEFLEEKKSKKEPIKQK